MKSVNSDLIFMYSRDYIGKVRTEIDFPTCFTKETIRTKFRPNSSNIFVYETCGRIDDYPVMRSFLTFRANELYSFKPRKVITDRGWVSYCYSTVVLFTVQLYPTPSPLVSTSSES